MGDEPNSVLNLRGIEDKDSSRSYQFKYKDCQKELQEFLKSSCLKPEDLE